MSNMTDEAVVRLWKDMIVAKAERLNAEADKDGHDWHSLWTGFVVCLGREDLTDWSAYMRLGFPAEGQ